MELLLDLSEGIHKSSWQLLHQSILSVPSKLVFSRQLAVCFKLFRHCLF